ncbi:MAG: ribosomal RNA small subunit methyltransferase A [Planctomycetes bacterium]|nr:ribosomal RNA small subunit methyltransferase A [Planctomycetota bacterium]
MKEAARQTRSYLMELFERHGFHPRTDLGQNFLIDLNLVEYIVRQAEVSSRDVVLEVGAGTGGLTTFLAQNAAHVVSVEVDRSMFQLAQEAVQSFPNVTLLNRDALRNKNTLDPEILQLVQQQLRTEPGRRFKLVSNLPFNIATPVVSNLVATDLPWERMVVTIQLELAQKMTAAPSSSQYGALSVWIQSQCQAKILRKLAPTVFWPRPKVFSAILRISPDAERQRQIEDREFFHDFLRRLFHQRRKFLRRVLVGMYRKQLEKCEVDAVLQSLAIDQNTRAEQLDVETLVELSNRLRRAIADAGGPEPASR